MRDFEAQVRAEQIDPADVLYLVSEMGKRKDDGQDVSWYTQVAILADRFPKGSLKPMAIMERMQALLPMLKDKRAAGWSFQGAEPGCTITHEAMFRAAALTSLHCPHGKRMVFKRTEFFRVALEQTDSTPVRPAL